MPLAIRAGLYGAFGAILHFWLINQNILQDSFFSKRASSAQRAGIVDRINVLVRLVFTNCFHRHTSFKYSQRPVRPRPNEQHKLVKGDRRVQGVISASRLSRRGKQRFTIVKFAQITVTTKLDFAQPHVLEMFWHKE
ncbi:hypothetical protein J6590_072978 [Homalodisca vitripennis]|nr:hypothetical protein J6590_072978 [Homalodisca vitripennis]